MNSILTFGENNSLVQNESINISNSKNINYLNLSNEELLIEINKKKEKIMEYHNTNKNLKKELTNILEKLNLLGIENKEKLNDYYTGQNNFQNTIKFKNDEYFRIKNYNSQLKREYETLLAKTKNICKTKISDIISEHKLNIQKIQNENKNIKSLINKNEKQRYIQQNKIMKIKSENLKEKTIINYNDKLNKYLDLKNNFNNSMNNSKKIIEDNIQELNKLENMIQNKNKIISKNEKILNKIKEDLNIIKKDMSGTVEEICQKCLEDKILIFSHFTKNNKNNNNKIFLLNENNSSKLSDENKKINTISSNVFLVNKLPKTNKKKLSNNNIKIYPIIHRNNSQSFITDKIQQNSIFKSSDFKNNLKQVNDLLSSNENNNNFYNNDLLSFENSEKRKLKEQLKFKKNYNSFYKDFSNNIFKHTDEEMYIKLQHKKEIFLEKSEALDFNINKVKKSFANKIFKIKNILQNNIMKLNDIKIANNNIQEEISKLQNLMKEIQINENKNKK